LYHQGVSNPLGEAPLNKAAAVIHLAAWRARAEENKYSREEMESTFPAEVSAALGVAPTLLLDDMPPLEELGAGMEALVS